MADFTVNWVNQFKGVDYAQGINQDWAGDAPDHAQNVNLLRIDLTSPHISFLVSPFDFLKPDGNKTTDFLDRYFDMGTMEAMYATNGNFFEFSKVHERNLFFGLAVSEGNIISNPYSGSAPYSLIINRKNGAIIVDSTTDTDAFLMQEGHVQPWTAVSGNCMLVTNGQITAPSPSSPLAKSPLAARTSIGLSEGISGGLPQYLFLLTIDGIDQQLLPSPYYGATPEDAATWMQNAGAYNAIGLDGGGSTTMALISGLTPGLPQAKLVSSPHDKDSMSDENVIVERSVAVSFGVIVSK